MTDTAQPGPQPSSAARVPKNVPQQRSQLIPIGAIATVVGIATCLLLEPTFGGVVVVAGILAQAWGLHRLGRGND